MPQSEGAAALSHATASLYLPRVLQWNRCVGATNIEAAVAERVSGLGTWVLLRHSRSKGGAAGPLAAVDGGSLIASSWATKALPTAAAMRDARTPIVGRGPIRMGDLTAR